MNGLGEFWQACDREGVQLCTVSRVPGGMFRLHAVKVADEQAADRFWAEAAARSTCVLQPLPADERKLCGIIHPAGGQCLSAATHAVIETGPGDDWTETAACRAHVEDTIQLVLYGPPAGVRPVWN